MHESGAIYTTIADQMQPPFIKGPQFSMQQTFQEKNMLLAESTAVAGEATERQSTRYALVATQS